jgi:diphthine-ammonia ligase
MMAPACRDLNRVAVAWSGGKDSALLLAWVLASLHDPTCLVCVLQDEADGGRVPYHGTEPNLLQAQAQAIGLPLVHTVCAQEEAREAWLRVLQGATARGTKVVLFGDSDPSPSRAAFHASLEEETGLDLVAPFLGWSASALAGAIFHAGIRAVVVAADAQALGKPWLGRVFDADLVRAFAQEGVNPCGQHGEYHTLTLDAPFFRSRILLRVTDVVTRGRYVRWDVSAWETEPKEAPPSSGLMGSETGS